MVSGTAGLSTRRTHFARLSSVHLTLSIASCRAASAPPHACDLQHIGGGIRKNAVVVGVVAPMSHQSLVASSSKRLERFLSWIYVGAGAYAGTPDDANIANGDAEGSSNAFARDKPTRRGRAIYVVGDLVLWGVKQGQSEGDIGPGGGAPREEPTVRHTCGAMYCCLRPILTKTRLVFSRYPHITYLIV